ncbi:indoleamine 2,3-dioxygenase 2 [Alligator mississippiensis]|uniref:Indoleamine 2,3-dioxygenase 2 n=1 Tax=Alligator mississippiensis TaxID=8496 RepID=A0A151M3J1_ALLMI|nr:indoleamine 2,3-dioxygenase 2 [Alligator mississippiensis]
MGKPECTGNHKHFHVDPDTFYTTIRLFLSGWRDNPAMQAGLLYEGESELPQAYSGGSAAQSTVLHAFDAFLGIRHHEESWPLSKRSRPSFPCGTWSSPLGTRCCAARTTGTVRSELSGRQGPAKLTSSPILASGRSVLSMVARTKPWPGLLA